MHTSEYILPLFLCLMFLLFYLIVSLFTKFVYNFLSFLLSVLSTWPQLDAVSTKLGLPTVLGLVLLSVHLSQSVCLSVHSFCLSVNTQFWIIHCLHVISHWMFTHFSHLCMSLTVHCGCIEFFFSFQLTLPLHCSLFFFNPYTHLLISDLSRTYCSHQASHALIVLSQLHYF